MNKILFFDTETTGLIPKESFQFEKVSVYPRLVQISALLYSESGILEESIDFIIKPEGFEINNSNIHGISKEIAERDGNDLDFVLKEFKEICLKSNLLVCHNYKFDSAIIRSELKRNNQFDFMATMSSFCTMTECSPVVKSISLKNLHYELFGSDFKNHHNSLIDTNITAKCFFKLLKDGHLEKKDQNYICKVLEKNELVDSSNKCNTLVI